MSLVVGGVSLLVATFGAVKLTLPSIATWSEGKEMFFGGAVVAMIATSFLLAVWLTRTASPTAITAGD